MSKPARRPGLITESCSLVVFRLYTVISVSLVSQVVGMHSYLPLLNDHHDEAFLPPTLQLSYSNSFDNLLFYLEHPTMTDPVAN